VFHAVKVPGWLARGRAVKAWQKKFSLAFAVRFSTEKTKTAEALQKNFGRGP